MPEPTYDVIIVGGGHNALTAAAYLGRAGLSVLLLERLDRLGGAAVSGTPFTGQAARLSRFSYLVSLLPDRIVDDLALDLELRPRDPSSYTPWWRDGRHGGLLVERTPGEDTRASFRELTGGDEEYAAWEAFNARLGTLASALAPTLLEPLLREPEARALLGDDDWHDFVEQPIGRVLEATFADDLVRGTIATDAVIGSFTTPDSLEANRLFLHHVIGNGTGDWRVPVGGMGAVTAALTRAAADAGADLRTGCGVSSVEADDDGATVTWHDGSEEHAARATTVLAGVAPWVLEILRGRPEDPDTKPVGAQLKINLLLDRLPRLASGEDPARAFAGTLHLDQGYGQLATAYAEAARGVVPEVVPGEVYCHTLTDPSIAEGQHTLTYFGVHLPAGVFEAEGAKEAAVEAALAGLQAHLAEPLEDCLARDAAGRPCIEALTPQEIEAELAMPGGHIYHGAVEWPWAGRRAALDTPAARWGVQTDSPAVLLCGSGAHRGGGISGLGGFHAAQAVLESR